MKRTRRRLLLLAASAGLSGCVVPGGLHRPTLAGTQRSVRRAVPLGTPAAQAWNIMQSHGYRCRYAGAELDCEASGTIPYEVFTRSWSARFILKDGRVADYRIRTDLDAL